MLTNSVESLIENVDSFILRTKPFFVEYYVERSFPDDVLGLVDQADGSPSADGAERLSKLSVFSELARYLFICEFDLFTIQGGANAANEAPTAPGFDVFWERCRVTFQDWCAWSLRDDRGSLIESPFDFRQKFRRSNGQFGILNKATEHLAAKCCALFDEQQAGTGALDGLKNLVQQMMRRIEGCIADKKVFDDMRWNQLRSAVSNSEFAKENFFNTSEPPVPTTLLRPATQEPKVLRGLVSGHLNTSGANSATPDTEPKAVRGLASQNQSAARPDSELFGLVGLREVKEQVGRLHNVLQIQAHRRRAGLPIAPQALHFVFRGNPGTGKTTIARVISNILKTAGVLRKGHVIETDRSGLVAEYVGQTAVKTAAKINEAIDGVLFIDEAYSLSRDAGSNNPYGLEAIDTLLKRMEDLRDRLVVIVAGYPKEMDEFIRSNPGFRSRFTRYIDFPDYSPEEMVQIASRLIVEWGYDLSPDCAKALLSAFQAQARGPDFGNAREVRNILEEATARQASRLAAVARPTVEELRVLEVADLPIARNEVA
jgi:stage V sporulation protein K